MLKGLQTLDVTVNGLQSYRDAAEKRWLEATDDRERIFWESQLQSLDLVIPSLMAELILVQAGEIDEAQYDSPLLIEVEPSVN